MARKCMYNVSIKKMSRIDKAQNLIKLYGDKKLSKDIINDYIKEIKDFDEKVETFKFNLVPDPTFCKAEIVPSEKGLYSVNLERYSDSLTSESLKEKDISDVIKYNLNENKLFYYKKVLSVLVKDSQILKSYISDFYDSEEVELKLGIVDNVIAKDNIIEPFVTIRKNDKDYISKLELIISNLKIHTISMEKIKYQNTNIGKSLLEKRVSDIILKDINEMIIFQKKFKFKK